MADDVIKEFLVSLGFETKDADKFGKHLDWAQAKAVALGEAMYDAAKEVTKAIADMVVGFDQLYWQSKNLGSVAGDIKAAGFAWSELGGSVGMANAAMKSISDFTLSLGGGGQSYLAALGVDPHDIGDAAKTMRDLEVIFQRMVATGGPNALARVNQIAGVLGISSDQLRVMLRDSGEYEDQYAKIAEQMGVNLDDAAKASNDLTIRMRLLQAQFELWADNEGIKVIKDISPYIQMISDKIAAIPGDKMQLAGDVIAGAFGAIALAAVVAYAPLIALAGAIALVLKAEQDWEKGDAWIKFRHESDVDRKRREADPANPAGKGLLGGLDAMWNSNWFSTHHQDAASGAAPSGGAAGAGPSLGGAKAIVDYFKSKGAGDIQAQGLAAMLSSESRLDPTNRNKASGAYGIAQWLSKDRVAEFKRITGHALQGSSLAEQLRFVTYELSHRYASVWDQMKRATSAIDVARIGIHGYEAPGAGEAGDVGRAARFLGSSHGGSSISQQTNIHVNGAGDPRAVADSVAAQQDAVNQRMVGNAGVFAY